MINVKSPRLLTKSHGSGKCLFHHVCNSSKTLIIYYLYLLIPSRVMEKQACETDKANILAGFKKK